MSKQTLDTDVLVIGGGPGGYSAAFRAADLGKKVVVVEKESRPGGTCLLWGCIPSKALLHVAKVIYEARESKAWGLQFNSPKIDLKQMRNWKDSIIDKLSGGLVDLHKKRNVQFIQATASLENSHLARLEGSDEYSEVRFESLIIAAGSSPITLPGLDHSSDLVMDSTDALEVKDIPKKLLVIGGGFIALELGQVYAELGSEVTVVELTDGLLPGVDRDLVRPVQGRLTSIFKDIHLNTKVTKASVKGKKVEVELEGELSGKHSFDKVFCAVGRKPNGSKLGLENTNVELSDRGFIEVDSQMRTAEPHIFAIGDIAGAPLLAHKAVHEGCVAAEVIAGENVVFDYATIPAVMYTDPEVAWCGLTETEAKAKGIKVKVAKFPWAASGRNLTMGGAQGTTKLIIEPETERILGVGICGPNAGELLAEGALAVENALSAEDVAGTIHAHPSLSETVGVAAEVFLGKATDLYVPKRK